MLNTINTTTGRLPIAERKIANEVDSCEIGRNERNRNTNSRRSFGLEAIDTTKSTEIRSKLFGNGRDSNGNLFPLFLPPQESRLNTEENSLCVGAGNKTDEITFTKTYNVRGGLLVITYCGYGLIKSVEVIGGKVYGLTNAELGRVSEEEKVDITEPLRQLLYAASMEEADFGSNMAVNNAILQTLGRIGIDTSSKFSVNNHSFQVNNGVIQSSGV